MLAPSRRRHLKCKHKQSLDLANDLLCHLISKSLSIGSLPANPSDLKPLLDALADRLQLQCHLHWEKNGERFSFCFLNNLFTFQPIMRIYRVDFEGSVRVVSIRMLEITTGADEMAQLEQMQIRLSEHITPSKSN